MKYPIPVIRALHKLGNDIANARKRRRIPVKLMAERAGISMRTLAKIEKGDAGIWQRRFWEHHIRGPEDYANAVRYCWNNPVKHGFVQRPEDWPYSSVHRDRQLEQFEGA